MTSPEIWVCALGHARQDAENLQCIVIRGLESKPYCAKKASYPPAPQIASWHAHCCTAWQKWPWTCPYCHVDARAAHLHSFHVYNMGSGAPRAKEAPLPPVPHFHHDVCIAVQHNEDDLWAAVKDSRILFTRFLCCCIHWGAPIAFASYLDIRVRGCRSTYISKDRLTRYATRHATKSA